MNQLYLSFDMSPQQQGFIQVGIAPKNPVNKIGERYYDSNSDKFDAQSSVDDSSAGTIIPSKSGAGNN